MSLSYFFIFFSFLFFFNDTATTEIYTLSLHDALPISGFEVPWIVLHATDVADAIAQLNSDEYTELMDLTARKAKERSEEHTSELQSPDHLVCRLLLEKKKRKHYSIKQSQLEHNSEENR